MTRKDYVLIAAALMEARRTHSPYADVTIGVDRAAYSLADALAADNAAFDRARFLKACGVQS